LCFKVARNEPHKSRATDPTAKNLKLFGRLSHFCYSNEKIWLTTNPSSQRAVERLLSQSEKTFFAHYFGGLVLDFLLVIY
jgi:hypothetical protein